MWKYLFDNILFENFLKNCFKAHLNLILHLSSKNILKISSRKFVYLNLLQYFYTHETDTLVLLNTNI